MMRVNCMPPRPRATIRLARLPAANARIRNSDSRNIGSATLASTKQKTTSAARPPKIMESTNGLVQPMACPP